MKYIIYLFLFITLKIEAQIIIPFTLTYKRKLKGIDEVPFNNVVVFDSRFDTTKIQITEDGKYPISIVQFAQPTTEAIKTYIENEIAWLKKINQTLYINIKRMRYTNIYNGSFVFTADAYFRKDNKFIKVVAYKNDDFRTDGFQKTVSKALCDLIELVNTNYHKQKNGKIQEDIYDSISTNVITDWKDYPIIKKSAPLQNGIYETFDDFFNCKIKPMNFSLQLKADSVYSITFPINNKHYFNESKALFKNIYAFYYDGNFYISVLGRCFLTMYKRNNTFYFNVPVSLPNMYSIISESGMYYDHSFPSSGGSTNPIANLAEVAMGTVQQHNYNKSISEKKQETINQGRISSNFRFCFLDMDTGDIIY